MNDKKNCFDWKRTASILICLAFGVAAVYLFLKYLFPILLPFALAALISAAVYPLAKKISEHSKIPKRVAAAVLVFILLVAVSLIIWIVAKRLATELGELAAGIGKDGDPISELIGETTSFINGISNKLSFALHRDTSHRISPDSVDTFLSGIASSAADAISAFLSKTIASVASSLPKLLLAIAVTVISSFYFALDKEKLSKSFNSLLPESAKAFIPKIKKEAAQTAGRYLRAYCLILLIMFLVVFLGLTLIGTEYALLLAAVTALVDILPVLGVGTVLVPWSVISFITGDLKHGVGLLVLYVVAVILRQFIEPKIIGKSLGIHPLVSLFSMYVGFRLFGVIGLLLAPAAVAGIRALWAGMGTDGDITQTL
jgi:sporulation integral membrane protein YtvI